MERGGEGGDRRGELSTGGGDEHDRAAARAASQPKLYCWRRELRAAAVAEAGIALPDFVPIVADRRADTNAVAIEIAVGDAVVRAAPGVDLAFLSEIIRLLKATA